MPRPPKKARKADRPELEGEPSQAGSGPAVENATEPAEIAAAPAPANIDAGPDAPAETTMPSVPAVEPQQAQAERTDRPKGKKEKSQRQEKPSAPAPAGPRRYGFWRCEWSAQPPD